MAGNSYDQGSYNPSQVKSVVDVDLVLCIDATGSMNPVIDMTKRNALNLPEDIMREARRQGKEISNLRMRVIVFRDYLADGEYAMQMTDFFDLPAEKEDMSELVNGIIASGGGDEPEDGLEALAYAMKSNWQAPRQGAKRRQVIAVWTDASGHQMGHGRTSPYYDPELPKDFDELTDWWGDDESEDSKMHYESKRLALFAPKVKPWTLLESSWDNVILYPSVAGQGMQETDYQEIIKLLVKTV